MSDSKNHELEQLCEELKRDLIEWLSLDDITAEELDCEQPLFGEGLGLDSLDAVEIVVMLQRQFGISPTDMDNKKEVFYSVKTLAQYVLDNRK